MSNVKYQPGTMRITDQVIEEVDEQMTVQSQRGHDTRPTAQSLFASYDEKPARSDPIDVPNPTYKPYHRTQSEAQPEQQSYIFPNNAVFSASAPDERPALKAPTINIDDVSYDFEDGKKSTDKHDHGTFCNSNCCHTRI